MRVDILTIFPGIFGSPLRESLLGKAIDAGILDVRIHDIRDFAEGPHQQVDDTSFGGGPGVSSPRPESEKSCDASRSRTSGRG